MSEAFNKMVEQYKSMGELVEFSEAQFKTIVEQTKKITELQNEIEHLKSMLVSTTPILNVPSLVAIDDEETISRVQLHKLKEISQVRELTLEEARKLEIYSKIINQIENRPKKNAIPTKGVTNEDLVRQLNEPEPENI